MYAVALHALWIKAFDKCINKISVCSLMSMYHPSNYINSNNQDNILSKKVV